MYVFDEQSPLSNPSGVSSVAATCEVLLLSEVYASRWAEVGRSEGRADLTFGRPPDRPEAWGVNVRAPTVKARRLIRPGAPLSETKISMLVTYQMSYGWSIRRKEFGVTR